MTGASIGAALIGLVLLVTSALAWSGAWKGWSRTASPHMMIAAAPGLGAALLLTGLSDLAAEGSTLRSVLLGLGLALAVLGLALAFVAPRWYGPAWFRAHEERR